MSRATPSTEQIIQENVRVHDIEAAHYDALHPEIFNRFEQRHLEQDLDRLLTGERSSAVDFGSGTGNIALKLAGRGLDVTCVDLSAKMLSRIEEMNDRRIVTVLSTAEEYLSKVEKLPPIVTMSSFLHQLAAPLDTLSSIAEKMPDGGRLYITHEPSGPAPSSIRRVLGYLDRLSWNIFHPRLARLGRSIDYSVSDFNARQGLPLPAVRQVLAEHRVAVQYERTYASFKSSWLSRMATRYGLDNQITVIAHKAPPYDQDPA